MGNQVTYFNSLPTDVQVGMLEYQNTIGNIWASCSGLKTFETPGYYAMSTITPATGYVVIAAYEFEKSGDEIIFSIIEAPTTWSGSSPMTVTGNMNRNVIKANPFIWTDGISTSGLTLSGGTEFCLTLLGGTAQGQSLASSVGSSGKIVVLKPSTRYAFKMLALGGATKVTLRAWLSHII